MKPAFDGLPLVQGMKIQFELNYSKQAEIYRFHESQ